MRKYSVKGLSLPEVMVVVAILGFLGLAISTAFTDMFKMQNRVVGNDEANEFTASLGRYFFNEPTCTAALQGKKFPVAGVLPLSLASYVGYGANPAKGPIAKGSAVGNGLRINQLELTNKNMPAISVFHNAIAHNQYLAQVQVGVDVRMGSKWDPSPPRSFEFPLIVDKTTNNIVKCMSSSSMMDACGALGATYNPATGKCNPSSQCYFEGMFVENICNGVTACTPEPAMCPNGSVCPVSGQCVIAGVTVPCDPPVPCPPSPNGCPPNTANDITGKLNCPGGASTTKQSGGYSWSFTVSCGKKCTQTINVNTNYYICLRCT